MKTTTKPSRSAKIRVRVYPFERERLEKAAARRGVRLSDFVRRAVALESERTLNDEGDRR